MKTKMVGKGMLMLGLAAALLLLRQGGAEAFALGIPTLDGFLTTIEQGVPRCGLLMALIGGAVRHTRQVREPFQLVFQWVSQLLRDRWRLWQPGHDSGPDRRGRVERRRDHGSASVHGIAGL